MKPFLPSSLALGLLPLLVSPSGYTQTTEKETKKQDATEVITVEGKRNQANSELTPETEKLIKVAGIENDPISSVFTMPGVVYAGGDEGGEPAIRGSSPDDNAFYIDDLPADYIFHLFWRQYF